MENGTAEKIKNQISQDEINAVYANSNIHTLLECISNMNSKPDGWRDIDAIFTAIQLCDLFKSHLDAGENDILKMFMRFYPTNKLKR